MFFLLVHISNRLFNIGNRSNNQIKIGRILKSPLFRGILTLKIVQSLSES